MTQPTEDPVARADAIKAELFREMTLENTPAAAQDDRYTFDDDVWMSEGNRSAELEKELHDLYDSDPDAFQGSEYEDWFAQPDNPDRPDESWLDEESDAEVDPEVDGHPGFSSTPWGPDTDPDDWLYEESDADRAADAAYREYLDDLDNPEPTGAAATPDTASFDALDAWWAEADRTGDASAAHDYARDFQETADRAAATEPTELDPPGDER